ncbi:MAG: ammonium transporter [Acidiferrobacterales bacterium]
MVRTDTDLAVLLFSLAALLVMHAGFALRQGGFVRQQNQAASLGCVIALFAVSTIAYVVIGYLFAYGSNVLVPVLVPNAGGRHTLSAFLVLLAFATAVPAIISGAIAERARFWPQLVTAAVIVSVVYPFFEHIIWGRGLYAQHLLASSFGAEFHDFAGSVVVHVMAGWLALVAVTLIGPRTNRYTPEGQVQPMVVSSVPMLVLGSWVLLIAWLAATVLTVEKPQSLGAVVAVNALAGVVGAVFGALIVNGRNPRMLSSGALAGLIAVGAGADIVHPAAALVIGVVAGVLFVYAARLCVSYWKLDDVVGAWALHGVAGAWGGIACGIFGHPVLGGAPGVSFIVQLIGTVGGIGLAIVSGFVIYGLLQRANLLRLPAEKDHGSGGSGRS